MVARQVVRLCRRRTAWENTDPREIAEVEFQDRSTGSFDLRPSVYVVSGASEDLRALVVRVRAEHSATYLRPPPAAGTLEFDVDGATDAPLEHSCGKTCFRFANAAHAELLLRSVDALLSLVARLIDERDTRAIVLSGDEVVGHAEARQRAGDDEWVSRIGPVGVERGEWGAAVARLRRKTGSPGT